MTDSTVTIVRGTLTAGERLDAEFAAEADRIASADFIQKNEKWGVVASGELFRLGEHGYSAGYIARPTCPDSFAVGIDAAEEESRVLMAQCRAEFGS